MNGMPPIPEQLGLCEKIAIENNEMLDRILAQVRGDRIADCEEVKTPMPVYNIENKIQDVKRQISISNSMLNELADCLRRNLGDVRLFSD